MNNRILWLRIAYWAGAIADALVFFVLLIPDVWAAINHVANFQPDWDFRYAQAYASALMAGWTLLLVWADRKPLERRGVLPITVFPVIFGLVAARYYLYLGKFIPVAFPLEPLIVPIVLSVLFLFAYFNSFEKTRAA